MVRPSTPLALNVDFCSSASATLHWTGWTSVVRQSRVSRSATDLAAQALGDGEIDFAGCHRVLKSIAFQGWLIVDLDIARQGPRVSYERCGSYVVERLEPIYA